MSNKLNTYLVGYAEPNAEPTDCFNVIGEFSNMSDAEKYAKVCAKNYLGRPYGIYTISREYTLPLPSEKDMIETKYQNL